MSYFSLYQFATKWDVFLILIGIIFTILKAATQPLLILAYSEFTTLLIERTMGIGTSSSTTFLQLFGGGRVLTNASVEENNTEMKNDSIAFGIFVGLDILIFFICGIGGVDCFNRTAFRQITRIRTKYFQSLIRQEVAYYDVAGDSNNFAARITEDIEKIQEGIAEKVSHYLYLMIASVISIIVSFTYGWELSLVMISYVPIVIITIIVTGKFRVKLLTKEGNAYSAAANVAEEVLSGIRTVFAFGGEQLEIERYKKQLIKERKAALVAKGWLAGFCVGVMRFLFFGSNALGFWYGVKLVLDDRDKTDKEYTPKILMNTFLGLLVGAENIAKTAPFIDTFATARSSAAAIFNVINRTSKIDSMSNDGNVLKVGVKRSILFKNVFFSYPSRPDVPILRGLDLEIQPGQSLALVGGSGSGKSTCLQLLQRFYDPNEGQVLIDGYDIRKLNINKLRSNIATVGQEPILFSTTIGENIRYGKPDASDKDIVAAAKMSGAHAFIATLPLGYNTLVGEKGSQLSGGQKQRIAIARAMIQNPKILLLDEATSALDYQSEKLVQETLDKVSQGRTTITVSHRLSAIRNADRIVFLDKGVVVEDGTHSQLMVQKGRYYEMITAGRLKDENEDEIEDVHQPVYNNFIENPIYMSAHPNNGPPVTISTPIINASPFFNDQNVAESYFRSVKVDVNERKVKDESDERIQYRKVFKRIFTLIKPQWFTVLLAVIFACFVGAILPTFAIIFGDIYGSLSNKDSNKVLDDTIDDCIMFVVMGIVAFFAILLQSFFFSKASFDLATRVRSMTFAAFMRQECSWFDEKNHSSAALSARLTGDVANLQEIFGNPLSMVFQSLSTFVAGIVIAFIYSWKLSLVCLIALPLAALTVFLDAKHRSKRLFEEKQSIEVGTKIASEAITNIRTVASLRQEKYMIERYVAEMKKASSTVRKSIVWRGLVNSTAQSIPYFGYTISLTYGGFLIANGEIEYGNVIKCVLFISNSGASFASSYGHYRPNVCLHSSIHGSIRWSAPYYPNNRSCPNDQFTDRK
ncbi:multidrug resistance protein homolog 65-like isoform X2 [Sitodiplosis mosellana]|uniref:multidrug resistance protein homolog 65-like isoform X2 n=1 Tax=Sitodiplosis mosellana TaxID=263140 RepID=UPI0024438B69|nr:multidrug resistance protein homolog 65-like isoform X2 [Sitodiplosis mosellana]